MTMTLWLVYVEEHLVAQACSHAFTKCYAPCLACFRDRRTLTRCPNSLNILVLTSSVYKSILGRTYSCSDIVGTSVGMLTHRCR